MRLMKFLAVTIFSGFLTACATTQSMNQQAAVAYTNMVDNAATQGAVDTSSHTAKRIVAVFNKMKPYAEAENTTGVPFGWQITVVRSDELNAWAMPGGKMMFYTGLVDRLNLTDDEIATVMGHEMTHALKEHSKSRANISAITDLAAQVGKAALAYKGISTNFGGYDVVDVVKDYGLDKPFSRSNETEADEGGLFLMAKAGYNPQNAPNVWKKMSKVGGNNGGFFSTHPANDDREENLTRLIPKALEVYNTRK